MKIELRNVSKSFSGKKIVSGLNLCLESGSWLSIIGTSGAGKTTILNLIAGLLLPDEGEIKIGDSNNKHEIRKVVSYLLQDFPLYPSLTVFDNLKLASKKNFSSRGPNVDELIHKLEIDQHLKKFPSMLSGGEKQRVALARSLLLHRPILLLDEPFSNIDVVMRRSLRRYCRELQKKWSYTLVLVTHDQEDAMSTSDWSAFLDNGEIVQFDYPEKMFDFPATRNVGDNFGDVGVIWLSAHLFENRSPQSNGLRETDFEISVTPKDGYWPTKILGQEYLGSRRRIFLEYKEERFSIVAPKKIIPLGAVLWILPMVMSKKV